MTVMATYMQTLKQWAWLCPVLMFAAAVGIFLLGGLSTWSALLITILLVCPATIVWGAIQAKRKPRPFLPQEMRHDGVDP